jgi:uncharacterized protein (TIGR00255 family)
MTAYGRGEYEKNNAVFIVELKSLNNRYRDIIPRIPRSLQALEDEIRSMISDGIRRGRVEVSIQIENKGEEPDDRLELNVPLVESYLKLFNQLRDDFGVSGEVGPAYLCQMKDVILVRPEEINIDETRICIKNAIDQALTSLDTMRIQEGKAIEKDFNKRLKIIAALLDEIEEKSPVVVEEYKKKLTDKIENLASELKLDESRLAQEVAIFASRCDITEEIVRMRSHLAQFTNYLSMDDSIGRRLDFLTQEINREVNTIASKSSDSSISANAVEMKSELEKLREQIQNVE